MVLRAWGKEETGLGSVWQLLPLCKLRKEAVSLEVYLEVTEWMAVLEKQGGDPGRLDSASQESPQVSCTVLVSLALPSSRAYVG